MQAIKQILENKTNQYNKDSFILNDPISIPHRYKRKEDIEISGFITAIFSWGRRDMIIKSANKLMKLMDNRPYDFIINADKADLQKLTSFYYRTFKADDLLFIIEALKTIYIERGGLEQLAIAGYSKNGEIKDAIIKIRKTLLESPHLNRSEKHLANPEKGSAAKRINMFLRWMIRKDKNNVDFGLWDKIPSASLMCPLDVHSGRTARKLGLLERKQNDWKAVEELTANLKIFDPEDPVKYDYALFGLSIFEDKMTS